MAIERVVSNIKMHPSIWFDDIIVSPFPRRNPLGPLPLDFVWMRKITSIIEGESICVLYSRNGEEQHYHYKLLEEEQANTKYRDCMLVLIIDKYLERGSWSDIIKS